MATKDRWRASFQKLSSKISKNQRLWRQSPKIGELRESVFISADSKRDNERRLSDVASGAFVNDLSGEPCDFRYYDILLLSDSDSDPGDCPQEFTATATTPERQRPDSELKKPQVRFELQRDQAQRPLFIDGPDSNEEDLLADWAVEEEVVSDIVKLLPDRPRADSPTLGAEGVVIQRDCGYNSLGRASH
ncbi:hypothetical protein M9X92_011445 [Pyricularia oryzae]|nr:hypothetical protein M9X92_011445 [Pyricularia oryzae]